MFCLAKVLTAARPLQIRRDVRDVYDKEDSPVQTSFKKLAEIIGYSVSCQIEWQMLWAELESTYPDKTTFVPTVAGVVASWCETLATRLEDDRFESWTEEFLSKIEPVSAVKLFVQVCNCGETFSQRMKIKGGGRPGVNCFSGV